MTVHWLCTCGDHGTYDAATAPKTDSALPDAKHQAHCTGSVTTTTLRAWAERARAGEAA